MTLQRRLLHAMLGLIGLAALAGVGTIFMPGREIVGRVAGTLVIAAIAMGLAIPASRRLDRQQSRSAGVFALAAIVLGFALGLLAIWGTMVATSIDEELAITALAYVPCAAATVVCFELRRWPPGRVAGTIGMLCAALTFLLWAVAIWGRSSLPSPHWGRFAGSGALVAAAALPLVTSLFGEGRRHWWRWIGAAAAAIGVLFGLYGIWISSSDDPTWLVQAFIVAAAIGGANVLIRVSLPAGQRWLVLATTGVLLATAIVASVVNIQTFGFQHTQFASFPQRLLAAGAIVTTCGVLAIVLLAAFGRRMLVTASLEVSAVTHIALTCPRCGLRQQAALGESPCTGCGLVFLLGVAEPHCPRCDHLLFDLRSGVCPECGEPVAGARPAAPQGAVQTSST